MPPDSRKAVPNVQKKDCGQSDAHGTCSQKPWEDVGPAARPAWEGRGPAGRERRQETRAQSPRGRPHGGVLGRPVPTPSLPSRHGEAAHRPLREATGLGGVSPAGLRSHPPGPGSGLATAGPVQGDAAEPWGGGPTAPSSPTRSLCASPPPRRLMHRRPAHTGAEDEGSCEQRAAEQRIRGVPSVRHTRYRQAATTCAILRPRVRCLLTAILKKLNAVSRQCWFSCSWFPRW